MGTNPKRHFLWKHIRRFVNQLCLADRFLLAFMGIVMVYLTTSLFFDLWSGPITSNVGAMIRTTGASIFGYFIGGSFLQHKPLQNKKTNQTQVKATSVQNDTAKKPEEKVCYIRQQTLIIGGIGLFALMVLLLLPAEKIQSPSAIAAISQMRDFVSGSVGLLIGHSSRGKD